uniref:Uncharacterized protein n=1 Tax=Rhizophora mucronata TaxID=61149 RepID=A0A2P2N191_RHIMU
MVPLRRKEALSLLYFDCFAVPYFVKCETLFLLYFAMMFYMLSKFVLTNIVIYRDTTENFNLGYA